MILLGHNRDSEGVGDDIREGVGGLPLSASILMYSVQVSQDETMGCAYMYTLPLGKVYINNIMNIVASCYTA